MARKKFKETGLGKFLGSKGFNSILETVGNVVPGVNVLTTIKDAVMGAAPEVRLSPDDLQQFLNLYQLELQELEMILQDKQNARQREIEIAKSGKTDWLMKATGLVALVLFLFLAYVVVYRNVPPENAAVFHHMLGIVEGAVISLYTYYWGSSKGSKDKTEILAQQND